MGCGPGGGDPAPESSENPTEGAERSSTGTTRLPPNAPRNPLELANPRGAGGPKPRPGVKSPDWKPERDTSAVALAKKADETLSALKDALGVASLSMTLPEGEASGRGLEIKIRDRNEFQLTFVRFEEGFPTNARAIADGKKRAVLGDQVVQVPVESTAPALSAERLVESWATDLPQRAVGNHLERRPAFSELLGALQKTGYDLRTEVRVLKFQGQEVKFHRVIAERKPAAAAQKGPHVMEIVFDAQMHLPVLIHSRLEPKDGKPTDIRWQAEWRGDQQFQDRDFVVPGA
jgi:hypothetical protein